MRVALYVRVSTEEQAVHGLSVDDQKESLKNGQKKTSIRSLIITSMPG